MEMDSLRERCLADGLLIEEVIAAYYTDACIRGVVVDGGANIGFHTEKMLGLPGISRVHAVEAHPTTAATLRARMLDHPARNRLRIHAAALQDDRLRAKVTFHLSSEHPGRSGIDPVMRRQGTHFEDTVSVTATTIDAITAFDMEPTAFIKLDLEGGEFPALLGARRTLQRHRPVVVFENGFDSVEQSGHTLEEFYGLWDQLGYRPYTAVAEAMDETNRRQFWYAWAAPVETSTRFVEDLGHALRQCLG